MFSLRDAIITGGDFRQQITHVNHSDSAIDRLQSHVAHTAFHNSAQRVDAPRCHPNTRVTVKAEAHLWAMRSDGTTARTSVVWLSGGAGAGKSAIAQSLAEEWFDQGILLASFFFSRSDSSRNHVGALVPTLVAQIYNLMPQEVRDLILQAVEDDSLIWSKDIFSQFHGLIAKPLHSLIQSGFLRNVNSPRIIVIDGLDECLDWTMQGRVIQLIRKVVHEWQLPIIFLVASRPEPDILAAFESTAPTLPYFRSNLSNADMDIIHFLRDKFEECRTSHPFRQYIPLNWPSDDAIYDIVDKSSGHFLYASITVQYVTSSRHHPHRRLETILNLRPPAWSAATPFAELNALYSQILSSVQDFPLVRRILAFRIQYNHVLWVPRIEAILQLEDGDVHEALADMTSLVSIKGRPPYETLRILHASFQEYLLDFSRSGEYHIDPSQSYQENIITCLSWLSLWLPNAKYSTITVALSYLHQCFKHVTIDLRFSQLMSSNFSLYFMYLNIAGQVGDERYFKMLAAVSHILEVLDASTSPFSTEISHKIRADFDRVICDLLEKLPNDNRLKLNIVAISGNAAMYYKKRYSVCLDENFIHMLAHRSEDDLKSYFIFPNNPGQFENQSGYFKELRRFFSNAIRSGEYAVCPDTLSGAVMFCIEHLQRNDIEHPTRKLLPKWSPRASTVRKSSPWKWRRRSISVVLNRRGIMSTASTVLPAYFRIPDTVTSHNDINIRKHTEWYHMALFQAVRLLPAAGYSPELVETCKHASFSSLSIIFPRLTRRVREAMKEYLVRWDCPLY